MQLTAVSAKSLAVVFLVAGAAHAQGGHPQPAPPSPGAKGQSVVPAERIRPASPTR